MNKLKFAIEIQEHERRAGRRRNKVYDISNIKDVSKLNGLEVTKIWIDETTEPIEELGNRRQRVKTYT